MKSRRFLINGIMSEYFHSKSIKAEKLAIFFYGFPATVGENVLTEYLTNRGFGVIQPQYYGSFDSSGVMDPDTVVNTVVNLIKSLNGQIEELSENKIIQIPRNVELLIGYSFGGYVVMHTNLMFPDLKNILMISPTVTFSKHNQFDTGVREDGYFHIPYIKRTRPFTYRIGSLDNWENLYNGKYDEHFTPNKKELSIISIFGLKDSLFDFAITKQNYEKLMKRYFTNSKCITEYVSHGSHKLNSLYSPEIELLLNETI